MLSFFKRRAVVVAIGIFLLALLIWVAGPYFAFADYRPLESDMVRLIAIGLLLLCWAASVAIKGLRAVRASDRLVGAIVKQARTDAPAAGDVAQLRERFEEAVAALKERAGRGRSLYDLPWYVIIGAPGSGKTTALVNSGLNFPLEQRSGKAALRGVGGTRNCDWWFTDEAVFLDTAGRYTTQDSDPASDSASWTGFLGLLRQYRSRRPLNGVILTISAQDLITETAASREAHVAAARRRLAELGRELGTRLPVYVMVTKVDLVAGFTEYFDDLTHEQRAQVWGVTFPFESSEAGAAASLLPADFNALITTLNERVFQRLEDERDVRRRAKIFGFPQQMATLGEPLAQFVADVFASTRADQAMWLRGVYFTSGTQEGTPIDRLLGAIGRRFGVAADAVIAPTGRGKAYFIEALLKDVVLPESGLAGVNRRLELRYGAVQLGAYAAVALVVLGIVVLQSVSYTRNRTYISEVAADVARLQQVPPPAAGVSVEALVPRLDAVRFVDDSANRYRRGAPWSMRWGLFQGTSVGNAARDAYVRELDGVLLPYVASGFRQRLIGYAAEPDKLYEYLKAYVMLASPEHLDKAQLAFLADLEWKSRYGERSTAAAALSRHFQNLLDYQRTLRPIPIDQTVVAQARNTIRQASIPRLMYRRLALNYSGDTARALRLDVASGVAASQVLRRRRGNLSDPIPSLYTKVVFQEVAQRDAADLLAQFSADRWVWGEDTLRIVDPTRLAADMMDVYEKDYIAEWDGVLNDLEVVSYPTLDRMTDALAILSGPASPLRALLQTVDANTFLVKPPDPAQPAGSDAQRSLRDRLGRLLGTDKAPAGAPAAAPGDQITAHFAPIHQLMAGAPGAAPIDRVLGQLAQVQQQLRSVGGGLGQTSPLEALTRSGRGDLLKSLQQDAATLPPPLKGLMAQIGGRSESAALSQAKTELLTRYQQDVQRECAAITAAGYPFVPGSPNDVPLADFGRLFGYGGVFDAFFKANLEPLVDTSRTPWSWRSSETGGSVGAPASMLRQFELARRVRESFFRPGAQMPELKFTVSPLDLDASATRFLLEVDGQSFDYRHGPERTWNAAWPGQAAGAAATFEDRTGARPNIAFQGPWAWFRLLDRAQLQRDTEARYIVGFQLGGHQAHMRIDALSIHNPYGARDLQQFRCGL